ncbi:MAG TPA: DNRLRE domain-containing protein [Caulobacteraceae bacterium]|jgi:hypothetical protein
MGARGLTLGLGLALALTAAHADPISGGVRTRVPAPPPTPQTMASGQNVANLIETPPAPTGVTSTLDPTVCTQHGGFGAGLACKAQLPPGGAMALVWKYPTNTTGVIGFHVYLMNEAAPRLVGSQANGPAVTFYLAQVPLGFANDTCFAVSAYNASHESPLTPTYCGGDASLEKTFTAAPTQERTAIHDNNLIQDPKDFNTGILAQGQLVAGDLHETNTADIGPVTISRATDIELYRAGLYFDLAPVMGHNILAAHLHISVFNAWVWPTSTDNGSGLYALSSDVSDHSTSCVAVVAEGTDRWWEHTDWINAASVWTPGIATGPDVSIDVTGMVQHWVSDGGSDNYGFVLEGPDESEVELADKACVTSYDPQRTSLEVKYQ